MFITIEGIEGAGKTTHINHIVDFLRNKGYDCIITREPGGTKIGEKIRAILLDSKNNDLDPLAELLLYMADRAQHINKFIMPHLKAGKTVISDRFFDATLVYQGYARGLDVDLIKKLHEIVFDNLKPDLTIILDLTPEKGLERAWKAIRKGSRTNNETRFEEETISFHKKVREGYLLLSRYEPERFKVIDATKSKDQVRENIIKVLPL